MTFEELDEPAKIAEGAEIGQMVREMLALPGAEGIAGFSIHREIVILSPICLLSVSLTQKVSDTKIWATGHACRAVRSAGWKGVLGAYPDHGDFEMPHWQFHELPGQVLADAAREWVATANVGMLGGCCGIGPEHIRALAAVCRESRAAA